MNTSALTSPELGTGRKHGAPVRAAAGTPLEAVRIATRCLPGPSRRSYRSVT
jgi:hypothetical protein